ncbi:7915_t:CDS:1, partial [Diversispora eburnea]
GCGKKFKLTQKSAPLFQWHHLEVFHDERCANCRLKEFKELIAEAQRKGQHLTEEGKEYLKELEEMATEESSSSSSPTPTSPISPPSSSSPTTSTSKLGKKKKRLTTE